MTRLLLYLTLLILTGCRSTRPESDYSITEAPVSFTQMSDSLPSDPAVEAIIAPYRTRLQERIDEVIGEATAQLVKGTPESALGNMAAEALLQVANRVEDTPVDMALTNNGGLRTPIGAGLITVGRMFELMPFENAMVILNLSAQQVDSLAQQIARVGGEPIAGFSFIIDETSRQARDIQVDGQPLTNNRTYRLVTSDYLAEGGGNMPVLWDVSTRQKLTLLLRDAFIEYVRDKKIIEPFLDGRIRVE